MSETSVKVKIFREIVYGTITSYARLHIEYARKLRDRFLLILSVLVFEFILLILTFLLIEGVFRVIGIPYKIRYIPNENTFARFDRELGWSYVPNMSAIHKADHITKPVHFDENGFRIPSPDFKFKYSAPSVLFIGDSFTMGHGLSYEESFVGKFDAIKEVQYQIVNMGVQGYGSDQALIALKKYLPKFNTKVVIYTFIEDHIRRNGSYDRRMLVPTARFLGTKPKFTLNDSGELYMQKKPQLYEDYTHSYLIDFLKMRIGTLLGSFPPFPEELTKRVIQEMKKYSNEHGAHFVVLNWRWAENDYDSLFDELDVDVIDTMDEAPRGWGKMVLLGGIHPDTRANNRVAKLLLNYFGNNGLLQKAAENQRLAAPSRTNQYPSEPQ